MGEQKRFLIVKNKDEKVIKYFEYDKIDGYQVRPKNNVKFTDSINVNKMILINPSLIEKMVDKKVQRKFASLITMLSIIYEQDDTDEGNLELALDELDKFHRELINKYRQYLEEEKFILMNKKIAILKDEVKLRMQYLMNSISQQQKEGKSR